MQGANHFVVVVVLRVGDFVLSCVECRQSIFNLLWLLFWLGISISVYYLISMRVLALTTVFTTREVR